MTPVPKRAKIKWTPEEDERLRKLALEGRSSVKIAEVLKREKVAVRRRAAKLKVAVAKAWKVSKRKKRLGPKAKGK
jgi:hypothetical protein